MKLKDTFWPERKFENQSALLLGQPVYIVHHSNQFMLLHDFENRHLLSVLVVLLSILPTTAVVLVVCAGVVSLGAPTRNT